MASTSTARTSSKPAVVRHADYVLVTADGEIDAANAHEFARFALAQLDGTTPLLVDLTELEFFGTAGFSALHTVNVQCAGRGVRWAVSASDAVARVLRICDPDGTLPVAGHGGVDLFELVAKPS